MRRGTGILPALGHGQDGHGTLSGFSLLEMMAVVNLIRLLAVFALPGFHSVMVHSHEVVLREELFALRHQIVRFTHSKVFGSFMPHLLIIPQQNSLKRATFVLRTPTPFAAYGKITPKL